MKRLNTEKNGKEINASRNYSTEVMQVRVFSIQCSITLKTAKALAHELTCIHIVIE